MEDARDLMQKIIPTKAIVEPQGSSMSGTTTRSGTPSALTDEQIHKVREYLTVILGSLEQLQRQPLDDRGQRQLRRADLAAQQMTEIIQCDGPLLSSTT
jgi:hypothetical protein